MSITVYTTNLEPQITAPPILEQQRAELEELLKHNSLKSESELKAGRGARYLSTTLQDLETEQDPGDFKELILSAAQLYFDGLIKSSRGEFMPKNSPSAHEIWQDQNRALNAILRGIQLTVAGYYRREEEVPIQEVREVILPHAKAILAYGSNEYRKHRHLQRREQSVAAFATYALALFHDADIDTIVPIASGGFEPAMLIADLLSIKDILPIRYSQHSRSDVDVRLPHFAPQNYARDALKDKRVLVVDDIYHKGDTQKVVEEWIRTQCNPKDLCSAVVKYLDEETAYNLRNPWNWRFT